MISKFKKKFVYTTLVYVQFAIQLLIGIYVSVGYKDLFSSEILSMFLPHYLIVYNIYNMPYSILSLLLVPTFLYFIKKKINSNYVKSPIVFILIIISLYALLTLLSYIVHLFYDGYIFKDLYTWPIDNSKNEFKRFFASYLLGNIIFGVLFTFVFKRFITTKVILD